MKEKILLFDLETAPLLSENWGFYDQTALRVTRASFLLSFAYKWLGDKAVMAVSHLNCRGKSVEDDRKRVRKLWELFNKADVVVAHNGWDFDVKMANAFFVHNGLNPPRPPLVVDTKRVAHRHFRFYSNKLQELACYLGLGGKLPHEGITLWFDCMAGKVAAWRRMVAYNRQDVILLEKVYLRLRPYMDRHPNYNVILGRVVQCPNCGGKTLQARGCYRTRVSKAQRYQCQSCGAWSHGKLQRCGVELR